MPVEKLPAASWPTTLALGFVSAVFDNISLTTALALIQGGPRAPKAWPSPAGHHPPAGFAKQT